VCVYCKCRERTKMWVITCVDGWRSESVVLMERLAELSPVGVLLTVSFIIISSTHSHIYRLILTALYHISHKSWPYRPQGIPYRPQPYRPQIMTISATTISATNHDHIGHNHNGHCGCSRYGHALWLIWFVADVVEPHTDTHTVIFVQCSLHAVSSPPITYWWY